MIAIYDTAKNFNRVLYWDDENRLTKSVDSTNGGSVATEYAYDTKGMRIIKDGPYGKSIYVDMGYVLSGTSRASAPAMMSNHVFVGNTRIASVVKHKEEPQAAMYFYASDHLGSSSVLTNQQGSYHERIEYLPYGESWVEDAENSSGFTTPYKFTGKELDKETGWYYFGARYYDARIGNWISTDPILNAYIPFLRNRLPAGGIFNTSNINLYTYAGNNPIKIVDPDGNVQIDMNQIQKGDIILRKEGGNVTSIIKEAGQEYGHAAIVAGVKRDSNGKVISADIIEMVGEGVRKNTLSVKGGDENLSQYDAFRVGTKAEGEKAVAKAESAIGKYKYDILGLIGLLKGALLSPSNWTKDNDNSMVCTEFVNWAYDGKFGQISGTTPNRIFAAQQFLGWDNLPKGYPNTPFRMTPQEAKRNYDAWLKYEGNLNY